MQYFHFRAVIRVKTIINNVSDMKRLFLFATLAAALMGCSKSNDDDEVINMLPDTRAVELTQEQRSFVDQNMDFSFNLFRAVNQIADSKKSSILSPISVTYVMGMLNDGAAGQTAKEITSVLGFGEDNSKAVNEFCKALIEQAPKTDPSVTLEIANTVIANKKLDVKFETQYEKNMNDYYNAEISRLDFSKQTDALKEINGWCNKKTHGMIPEILKAGELSPSALLVLMNAIYFKATWTEKFNVADTRTETFTTQSGQKKSMPMMHRKAAACYGGNDVCTMLNLPYGSGNKWSMMILLPNEGKTVNDVINSLSKTTWQELTYYKNTWDPIVDIKIPRFTTEFETDLISPLSNLGAPTMFIPRQAEFPNISTNYKKDLYVSLMKQKAAIEVSEEGTKASAVTIAEMDMACYIPPIQERPMNVDFHCNRPFVYIIQESSTGAIFFLGTYRGE